MAWKPRSKVEPGLRPRGRRMVSRLYFAAVIDKNPDGGYRVAVPDFPGCVSAGGTLDEAVSGASEALASRVGQMLANGDEVPEPMPLETVAASSRGASTVAVTLLPVTLPGKALRVNIMIDEALLDEIDAIADNRSRFLADAARAELARRRAG